MYDITAGKDYEVFSGSRNIEYIIDDRAVVLHLHLLPVNSYEVGYEIGRLPLLDQVDSPSLRDQFAIAALTGLISKPPYYNMSQDELSQLSYSISDKMMKARK